MIDANVKNILQRRAERIGSEKAQKRQLELMQILQDAVPDGSIEKLVDGGLILRGRRLFVRMMNNERLRAPHSFLDRGL